MNNLFHKSPEDSHMNNLMQAQRSSGLRSETQSGVNASKRSSGLIVAICIVWVLIVMSCATPCGC